MTAASTSIALVAIVISVAILILNVTQPRQGELALAYACGRHDGVVLMTKGSTIPAALDRCEKYRGMVTALEHQ